MKSLGGTLYFLHSFVDLGLKRLHVYLQAPTLIKVPI
jgi:hypothetical protein